MKLINLIYVINLITGWTLFIYNQENKKAVNDVNLIAII